MKGLHNPKNFFESWKYRKSHKNKKFPFYGIKAYMGEFGSGKTLSCVKYCYDILENYPKAIFITNTEIKGINNKVYYFGSAKELVNIMSKVITEKNNNGYVIMIDELHVVLSDLFNNSDPIFLTYLSQLRKLRYRDLRNCPAI